MRVHKYARGARPIARALNDVAELRIPFEAPVIYAPSYVTSCWRDIVLDTTPPDDKTQPESLQIT